MENSISEKKAPEFVVELEVDQENLVKMLKALADAGVEFRLKYVEEKEALPVETPSASVSVTPVPDVFVDLNVRWHVYPQPYTVGPIVSPYTNPGTAVPPNFAPPSVTICEGASSSTVVGVPPGSQVSFTSTFN